MFISFILQLIQVKVHDFNTLLVQETVRSVYMLQLRDTQIGRCCPRQSITVQHLLGMDWIRLWITGWDGHLLLLECLEQLTHVCRRRSLCLEHVCPTRPKCVQLGLNRAGNMGGRGEFGRCCWRGTVWCSVLLVVWLCHVEIQRHSKVDARNKICFYFWTV